MTVSFTFGQIPTPEEWNAAFASKPDAVGGLLTNPTIDGGTFTNSTFSGDTNLAVIGTLSSTGIGSFGLSGANHIDISGGTNGTIAVLGGTNSQLLLRSLGTSGVNIGSSTGGGALIVNPAATNGGALTIQQPTTASNLIGISTSNTTTGGLNFTSPMVFTRNVTYSGDRASSILNRPFTLTQSITGTSNNQSGFGINLISTALSNYQSYAGTRALDILITSGANTTVVPMIGLSVHSQQAAAPATVADLQWLANHAYTPVGTLVVNGVNLYQLTVAGTSAASGGPTGTGGAITDGTCTWAWQDFASDVYRNITLDILAGSNFANGATSVDDATGSQWGAVIGSFIGTPAQHYSQNVVLELDDNVQGSVNRSVALEIAKEGNQGDVYDYGIWIAAIGAQRYRNTIFLSEATDPNGVVFSVSSQATPNLQTMAGVFDCLMANPSGSNTQTGWMVTGGGGYILRGPNSQWRGTGDLQIGNAGFVISANTLTIDTTYQLLSAVGALSGGTNWTTGDNAVDAYGNVGTVTATAGVPTALNIVAKQKTYVATASLPGGAVSWYPMHVGAFVNTVGGRFRQTSFTTASETYTPGTTLGLGTAAATILNIGNASSVMTLKGAIKAAGVAQSLVQDFTLSSNGADTTEDTLKTFNLAANQLLNVGDRLLIVASGALGATTDSKVVRIKFGGTVVAAQTSAAAAQISWRAEITIVKTGSNTQGMNSYIINSTAPVALASSPSITDTAAITVLITGQNNTNSVANSINCRYLTIDYIPFVV